jgi:hypothetical protein
VPSGASSSPPSSPAAPAGWSELSGFRETCLLHFPAEDADALRRAGVTLHRLGLAGPDPWPAAESVVVAQVRAALLDLRYTQGYLAMLGEERRAAALPPAQDELAQAAEQAARHLGALAHHLEAALT